MASKLKAKIVDDLLILKEAGSIEFYQNDEGEVIGMTFYCPSGSGEIHGCNFGDNGWNWDGNLENPTLSPSIWANKPNGWHGFLREGVWVEC